MPGMYEFSVRLLAQLADVSVRSLCLAGIALLAIFATRTRGAAARHAVWTAILAAMLALLFVGTLVPPLRLRIATWQPLTPAAVRTNGLHRGAFQSGGANAAARPAPVPAPSRWPVPVAAVYLAVAFGFLARFLVGYGLSRRLVRNCEIVHDAHAMNLLEDLSGAQSLPWPLPQLRASNAVAVPMTVGWREPAILVPGGWQSWDEWKLRAVIAHELAHIRRRDWLVALGASLNRCLFWFHPLAWWLERRLGALAEQASDDAALASTGDAPRYARVILEFAALLQTGGRRLVLGSVAMARTPHVSRRIDRILALRRPSPGIVNKKTWVAILACAVPLVYSAAALQLTQPPAPHAANPGLAQLLTDGSRLSAAEAQQLEQQLARDPEDLAARAKLVSYYIANGIARPPRQQILWLIEHHPESEITIYFSRSHMLSQVDYDYVKTLWLEQVAAHPDNARVVANAAVFIGEKDQFAEEGLLKRVRQLEPSNPEWTRRLADRLSWAIARWFLSREVPAVPPTEPDFAAAAKAELETSTDATIVGTVGEFLSGGSPGGRPPAQPQSEYAEHLLQRAQTLEPQNAEWSDALERLHASHQQASVPPPPPTPAGVQRIRVGAAVQQSNLLHFVPPEYPPLARQARIQGVVRFNVIIGKDGHISNIILISGHPLLVPTAQEAVQQWVYRPTLLNGDPVEVATVVDVQFALSAGN
jgi:TonB family protein